MPEAQEKYSQQEETPRAERTERKKIIVDIGAGYGSFASLPQTRKFKKNEIYIGIEPDPQRAEALKSSAKDVGDGTMFTIRALGEKIPLDTQSTDEVIIKDVLGDPKVVNWFAEKEENELQHAVEGLAKESFRILKSGGKTIVIESYTPYSYPKEVIKLFENNGFTLSKYFHGRDNREADNELKKFMPSSSIHASTYLLEFFKPEQK